MVVGGHQCYLQMSYSFNHISVISGRWKGEHERLCVMKRHLVGEESRLQRDSNPQPRDPKSGALTAWPHLPTLRG